MSISEGTNAHSCKYSYFGALRPGVQNGSIDADSIATVSCTYALK